MEYENILLKTEGRVAIVTLNRPKALNALNSALLGELVHAASLMLPAFFGASSTGPKLIPRLSTMPRVGCQCLKSIPLSL